jgi:hypothetical protein
LEIGDASGDPPRLLIGTHTYAAGGDAARRQSACVASLASIHGAQIVNVQFEHEPHHVDGIETLAVLRTTSNRLSGRAGPRKPDVAEIFAVLARAAASRGIPLFGFTNADIIFTQQAIDWMTSTPKDAFVLSRENFEAATGMARGMELSGTDVFVMTTKWWQANAHRFRSYVLAEGGFDNVYTAIMMCHADCAIENRRPLIRHEIHPMAPMPSPHFGEYIRLLCALDAQYFSRWCRYWDGLVRLRGRGASEAEEHAWADEAFAWHPSLRELMIQRARNVKARLRYWWWRHRQASA